MKCYIIDKFSNEGNLKKKILLLPFDFDLFTGLKSVVPPYVCMYRQHDGDLADQ